MLQNLVQSLVFKNLKNKLNKQKLTSQELQAVLEEIRFNLLDADVNLEVVTAFTKQIEQQAPTLVADLNQRVDDLLLVLIKDELIKLLGATKVELDYHHNPLKIMLVGINGSGKTTTAGKLAHFLLHKHAKKPLLVAVDIYRPAAIEQLRTLAKQIKVAFFEKQRNDPANTSKLALELARQHNLNAIIVDTAGRLQTNTLLMAELVAIKQVFKPNEILFVADGMSGQDIVRVAQEFDACLRLTGLIVTKLDSQARAGALLSLTASLRLPVKFIGTGERVEQLEFFYAERMANRILGLGDLMTLAETAVNVNDEQTQQKMLLRLLGGKFDLEDFSWQLKQVHKMGGLNSIFNLLPNMNQKIGEQQLEAFRIKFQRWEVIMQSMTLKERRNPRLLLRETSRKQRIIKGSGCKPDEFNKLIKEWEKNKLKIDEVVKKLKLGKDPMALLKQAQQVNKFK